jgi:hypothetical protein
MAYAGKVGALIAGFDRMGVGDEVAVHKEMSRMAQDFALLVGECERHSMDDFIQVWRYMMYGGHYRRFLVLCAALGRPCNLVLEQNPLKCEEEVQQFDTHLQTRSRILAVTLKHELLAEATGAKLPVVDAEVGGTVYGYASSRAEAVRVAQQYFADPVERAYLQHNAFTLFNGTRVTGGGWVALVRQPTAAG